ncbi:unnamed protein product [Leptosia nina]|uniref:EGF-like domain-containing protein n=1 Tax=Leptosia nina TaxID=320188 RepID=A0AAV1JC80_9NEOP
MMWKLVIVVCILYLEFVSVECLKAGARGVCVVKSSTRKTRAKPVQVAINKWCGKKKCTVRRTKLETFIAWRTQTVCCAGWQYRSEDDTCIPQCSTGCNGGICTAPDTCVCESPAVVHPNNNTCIIPECNPPCINSHCVNNSCICNPNYEQFNTTHCYQCNPGYIIDANFTCIKCQCMHGTCINNTCVCNEGYALKGNICEAVCSNCNGECIGPDICQCLNGYANIGGRCVPICGCEKCIAPNVCDCPGGYRDSNGTCAPICDRGCVNGYCSAPNLCSCNEGFLKDGQGVCRECSETCSCGADGECLDATCKG